MHKLFFVYDPPRNLSEGSSCVRFRLSFLVSLRRLGWKKRNKISSPRLKGWLLQCTHTRGQIKIMRPSLFGWPKVLSALRPSWRVNFRSILGMRQRHTHQPRGSSIFRWSPASVVDTSLRLLAERPTPRERGIFFFFFQKYIRQSAARPRT